MRNRLGWEVLDEQPYRNLGKECVEAIFHPSHPMVGLRACLDASSLADGRFTVAGVAFGYDHARRANREWNELFGDRVFHMTDLHARKRAFKGVGDEEVARLMKGVVDILKRHASYMVTISCDLNQLVDHFPTEASERTDNQKLLEQVRSPYGFICSVVMVGLGMRAKRKKPGNHISYIFEKGDNGQRGLVSCLEHILGRPEMQVHLNSYSYRMHAVIPKEELQGIFHAADFIAWEWGRHVKRYLAGQKMRKSLSVLVDGNETTFDEDEITLKNGKQCFFRHLPTDYLKKHLKLHRETLVAPDITELDAAFTRWVESL